MLTATPNPKATVIIEHHEGDWREEQRYAIIKEDKNFVVLILHEVFVEDDVLCEWRDRWAIFRGSATECRQFCSANDITPHLDYSIGSV
jgi:hypothetical protein